MITMLVCHCKNVSDRDIKRCVRDSGARNRLDVARECGAGTGCGGCLPLVEDVIREAEAGYDGVLLLPMLTR